MGKTTDSDRELELDAAPDTLEHANKIFKSNDVVDQRIVRLYQIKRTLENRKKTRIQQKEEEGQGQGGAIEPYGLSPRAPPIMVAPLPEINSFR